VLCPFTDLANPYSNRCYAKMGFKRVWTLYYCFQTWSTVWGSNSSGRPVVPRRRRKPKPPVLWRPFSPLVHKGSYGALLLGRVLIGHVGEAIREQAYLRGGSCSIIWPVAASTILAPSPASAAARTAHWASMSWVVRTSRRPFTRTSYTTVVGCGDRIAIEGKPNTGSGAAPVLHKFALRCPSWQ